MSPVHFEDSRGNPKQVATCDHPGCKTFAPHGSTDANGRKSYHCSTHNPNRQPQRTEDAA